MKSFSLHLSFFSIAFFFFFISCNNENEQGKTNSITSNETSAGEGQNIVDSTHHKYDYVISNIPIPYEIIDKLYHSEVLFNKQFTNPASNIDKYIQNTSKALNLGIYGADLTYVIYFEQLDEFSPYLKNSKKIADDLGIPLAFNKEILDECDKYHDNKDSLQRIIYKSYHQVDKTLKSNERISLAALVVTGGWIEGLYLTTKTLGKTPKNEKTKELYKLIAKQGFHLNNIIDLLNDFKSDPYYEHLLTSLNKIKTVYDSASDRTTINETEVASIAQMISIIRNTITEGS